MAKIFNSPVLYDFFKVLSAVLLALWILILVMLAIIDGSKPTKDKAIITKEWVDEKP